MRIEEGVATILAHAPRDLGFVASIMPSHVDDPDQGNAGPIRPSRNPVGHPSIQIRHRSFPVGRSTIHRAGTSNPGERKANSSEASDHRRAGRCNSSSVIDN
jgi:hypothetical protein